MASYATMLLAVGTILGCLLLPLSPTGWPPARAGLLFRADVRLHRGGLRLRLLPARRTRWPGSWSVSSSSGLGGANFAVYTLWLPEQYRTECRGSAFAFATSFGRFIAAGITFLVGAGVARMHTIGTPVALTSVAFLMGIALLPLGEETSGKELPV